MRSQFEYGTLADSKDAQQLGAILEQCFNSPPGSSEAYFKRIGLENFRLLRVAGQLAGGLATLPMGQWFGNQRVPMTGIAAVGVAPEYRGSGAAIALMQHTLQDLYASGVALSALYPATQQLYRKAGYEQGGSFCTWEISAQAIQVKERSLPVQPIHSPAANVFQALSQQQSQTNNGNLDRHPAIWEEILKPDAPEVVYAYLFGDDQPEGYIIFSQKQINNSAALVVLDWAILTPAAGLSFWKFLANHRSQIKKVRWRSSAIDLLTLLLPEQSAKLHEADRWLLRIVNVISALEKRGYPSDVEMELHLDIQDDLLPDNSGKFILSVSNGQGTVTRGGKGELRLEICGLAPLYTGLFSPCQLQLLGQLEASERAIATATHLFAGSHPWLRDFF
ncbi:MAG: GNAT family N-acetyltransferase [Leptolyngbyaceae cyanobacterium RM1_405_57]|nr:GNAT family N-acetyltransferase [Leptolyngbyaceae cyanobacterium RM1_405_57]